MSPRFQSIEQQGIKTHIKAQGVDWDKLVWLIERDLSSAAIAKALDKDVRTISKWRKMLTEDQHAKSTKANHQEVS